MAQVTKATGVTKGLVSRYLNTLHKWGLITRHERIYLYSDSTRTMAIKILLNLNKLNEEKLIYKWMTGFGLFGSWAKGTNTHESDIDIWIKTKVYPSELELSKLQKKIIKISESEVNLVILTPKKIKELLVSSAVLPSGVFPWKTINPFAPAFTAMAKMRPKERPLSIGSLTKSSGSGSSPLLTKLGCPNSISF